MILPAICCLGVNPLSLILCRWDGFDWLLQADDIYSHTLFVILKSGFPRVCTSLYGESPIPEAKSHPCCVNGVVCLDGITARRWAERVVDCIACFVFALGA